MHPSNAATDQVTIKEGTLNDIPIIIDIAEQTWWPSYSAILSKEQIRYMLDVIFNPDTLRKIMEDGTQQFLLLYADGKAQGFASFGPKPEDPATYKLSKIYVLPENHGKGYGKKLIDFIVNRLKEKSIHTLDLNVNRYNPAKTFYERLGFTVIGEEDIPIGPYWMNDYVMRLGF